MRAAPCIPLPLESRLEEERREDTTAAEKGIRKEGRKGERDFFHVTPVAAAIGLVFVPRPNLLTHKK